MVLALKIYTGIVIIIKLMKNAVQSSTAGTYRNDSASPFFPFSGQ